mmetsp:Transcript_11282/g.27012  ORF Transcript_11282/g.27012 Transcript_11282/m.27012 type:complete len:216 (-) Transcript_11282:28-675(-)
MKITAEMYVEDLPCGMISTFTHPACITYSTRAFSLRPSNLEANPGRSKLSLVAILRTALAVTGWNIPCLAACAASVRACKASLSPSARAYPAVTMVSARSAPSKVTVPNWRLLRSPVILKDTGLPITILRKYSLASKAKGSSSPPGIARRGARTPARLICISGGFCPAGAPPTSSTVSPEMTFFTVALPLAMVLRGARLRDTKARGQKLPLTLHH